MSNASTVHIKGIGLSARAISGINAALPSSNGNPTVQQVIEGLTVERLLETPNVGEATIAEIEAAFREHCDVAFIDSSATK